MIQKTVCEPELCMGCMACFEVCPKNAISIVDKIKEYNAVIDENKCINCNACYKICQVNKDIEKKSPIYWKQGWTRSETIRSNSSSGGLASAIEAAFIKDGGVVCSCCFNEGQFVFEISDSEESIKMLAGSKYVKSNPIGIYRKIENKLQEEKKVLFVGLPCQVVALKRFIGKQDQNLYTVDLICHGTPSPKVLELFLQDYGYHLDNLTNITFRKKNKYGIDVSGLELTVPNVMDRYIMTFLESSTYTQNCYSCPYATIERTSDLTLGDSWGTNFEKKISSQGISLALAQSEKGISLVDHADLMLFSTDLEKEIMANRQLNRPSEIPKERKNLFNLIDKGISFKYAVWYCYPKYAIKSFIKFVLYKFKKKS